MKKAIFMSLLALSFFTLSAKQDRPNIVFIVSEDNGYDYMSFNGNELAKGSTPNLDKLAKEGVVYDRAYSNGAVCAVARSTMITAMYASSLGTTHMRSNYPIPSFIDGYARLFRKAGYVATNHSKMDYNTCSLGKEIWDNNANPFPKDKPFIAVYNILDSHESRIFPDPKKTFLNAKKIFKVNPDEVELAPFYVDTPQQRTDIAFYYECLKSMDSKLGKILKKLEESGTKDDTFIIYSSDHGGVLPRSKRYLEDTGTHIPFIIYVPKNWQEYAIQEAGTRNSEIAGLIDIAPTLLSIAGIEAPEYMEGKALMGKYKSQKKSKYAYLYSGRYDTETYYCFRRAITDGEYRYIRDFYSFVPYALNCEYPYRQEGANAWVEAYGAGNCNEVQGKYFKSLETADILYHTSQDKWEVNNIAQSDSQKLQEMKQDLYEIMLKSKDAGIYPEPFFYNMKEGETVYDIMRREDFEYEKVLELAWESGEREAENAESFIANLKNENSTMRFWSIIGLANLKEESAAPALKEVIKSDAEIANRALAALALHTINKDEDAKKFLENINDDYIKSAEPKASVNKIAYLKAFTEGTLAIIDDRMPLIGSIQYLNKFGLNPAYVEKKPAPEIRKVGRKKF